MTSSAPAALPWHDAPRRWGHGLHSQCSYMAMFPPALPHFFIRWLTRPGEVVYDPFSGRGTTLLEAGLLGRCGLGSDANPLAWILSASKTQPCSRDKLIDRIAGLRRVRRRVSTDDVPRSIRPLFSASVLGQLVSIKRHLDARQPTDRFLLATLCGILHANARKDGTPRGLTVAMPNTFAMAPAYVVRYIKEHDLKPPDVDVLEVLTARLQGLNFPHSAFRPGAAWIQDARKRGVWPQRVPKASLVLTSPPYLAVMKYGKLNWIRSWLIGAEPKEVDRRLFSTSSLPKYLEFMTQVLKRTRSRMRDDGYMCLVIGDVRRDDRHLNLAKEVVAACVPQTDLHAVQTIADSLPTQHKVSRIWGDTRGRATKIDRIIVLAGPKARGLPALPKIDWLAANSYGE